jgi:RimJ/RimL family protein N-acetyltransferase
MKMLKTYFKKIFVSCFFLTLTWDVQGSKIQTLEDFMTFETERTTFQPIRLRHLEMVKALESEEEVSYAQLLTPDEDNGRSKSLRFTPLITQQESLLEKPWTIIQDPKETSRKQTEGSFKIYFGVFKKSQDPIPPPKLLGLIDLYDFEKEHQDEQKYLTIEIKFGKDSRGQGYGSEAVLGLTRYLQEQKLLAQSSKEPAKTHYRGLLAIINPQNKASLSLFLKKSHFRIGQVFGDSVYTVYPDIDESILSYDVTLHDQLCPLFEKYLDSKDEPPPPKKSKKGVLSAEAQIISLAFKNLITTDISIFTDAFKDEEEHFARALSLNPELTKHIPADRLILIKEMLLSHLRWRNSIASFKKKEDNKAFKKMTTLCRKAYRHVVQLERGR